MKIEMTQDRMIAGYGLKRTGEQPKGLPVSLMEQLVGQGFAKEIKDTAPKAPQPVKEK